MTLGAQLLIKLMLTGATIAALCPDKNLATEQVHRGPCSSYFLFNSCFLQPIISGQRNDDFSTSQSQYQNSDSDQLLIVLFLSISIVVTLSICTKLYR